MKIRPAEAELFHADGRTYRQTDMTKLIVAFRNFCEGASKNRESTDQVISLFCSTFTRVEEHTT